MRTPVPRRRPWRATIVIVALYALVLSSFLAGLGGVAPTHAASHDAAFAICHAAGAEADGHGPGDVPGHTPDDAPLDCRALCRAQACTGTLLHAPRADAGLPIRFVTLGDAPARVAPEAPAVRRIAAPLGSRAPPDILSLS